MSEKKLYSFNLCPKEMDKLDRILEINGRNRTEFFQGFIREYNRLHYVQMDVSKGKVCGQCGKLYKGVYTCPHCEK